MTEASNYMNLDYLRKPALRIRAAVSLGILQRRKELKELASMLIEQGPAIFSDDEGSDSAAFILHRQANFLHDISASEDVAQLFNRLEMCSHASQLVKAVEDASGL